MRRQQMSTPPSRVLVLGGTGMLGHAAVTVLAETFEVVASARDIDTASGYGLPAAWVRFDARLDDPRTLLARVRPDAVLNAIGLVKQLPEGQNPEAAIRLNALLPHVLAGACAEASARLVHISTDCVFSGELPHPGRYSEADVPDARDVYGRSKLLGEVYEAGAVTLRTSIIGRELVRASGLLEWFAARSGETVNGFTRAYFSGLTTRELSRVIRMILLDHPQMSGLWHVSAGPIDKHTLICGLREVLGVNCEIVPRPEPVVNRALDSTRFAGVTGYCAPTWPEMLEEFVTTPHG
jgi:dTDP-4-dehydrorhamnose reductase